MKTILTLGLIALTINVWSQEYNKEIALEGHQPFMVGQINLEGLSQDPYNTWFAAQVDNYTVDANLAKNLKKPSKTTTSPYSWVLGVAIVNVKYPALSKS